VPSGTEAAVCAFVEGDCVAVIGGEPQAASCLLSARFRSSRAGRGVILQRYKDGHLLDATSFVWKEGIARCPMAAPGRRPSSRIGAAPRTSRPPGATRLRAIGQFDRFQRYYGRKRWKKSTGLRPTLAA